MKTPALTRALSRLYILKLVQAGPMTVLSLADRLRESGFNENIRSLRPTLRSLMIARAITAQLIEGTGRVYCITDEGRQELDVYLAQLEALVPAGRAARDRATRQRSG
ncbi:transcriptional regulator [Cupriavidus pauculus]|jgi:DNA-binding PadR family transcriptional regulator|uniref:PadR family transcriptional regulator n=1 Tax=Cupriavidus pauculus TaxID=82633 RepID=UPI0030F73B62